VFRLFDVRGSILSSVGWVFVVLLFLAMSVSVQLSFSIRRFPHFIFARRVGPNADLPFAVAPSNYLKML
jgi:hypothetical protein